MISDLRTLRAFPDVPAAVVVVGSGAAGLALTDRLTAAGRSVILLESGTDLTASDAEQAVADDLNQGVVTGHRYYGLTGGRKRVLGGAAQLWHGQCTRLHDLDMQHRPWIAHSGWPFGLDELSDSYDAAERWLGVTGLGYGEHRWSEHPRLAPLAWNPDYLLHDFTEYTARPMLGRVHRPSLAANPRAHVYTNATVAKICTDGERVSGVEVIDPAGHRLQVAATQVVLAAGAIENARVLQLSDPDGIGLGHGREHTGRFLQDHPIIDTAIVSATDYRVLQDRYVALHRGHRRLFPKVRLSPQAQQKYELLDANAVFMHEHNQPAMLAARRLVAAARARQAPESLWRDARTASRASAPIVRDAFRRWGRGLATAAPPSTVKLQVWLEQAPDADSRLKLGSETDALGLRRAEVDWRTDDLELETSRRMTRWIADDLERLGIAKLQELPAMSDDDAWREAVSDAFHPAGTTRMSVSPADGVVDPDLQVHGIGGLHVVGGSVFPITGYANPTLTIVALAVRLADRLSKGIPSELHASQ